MNKTTGSRKILIGAACFAMLISGSGWLKQEPVHAASIGTAVQEQASSISSSSSAAQKNDAIVSLSKSLIGKVKYKFGVNNPAKLWFDCSSFTKYVFSSQGISLPWGTSAQSKLGVFVSRSNLQKGDLIFFSVATPGKINHVGIYIGGGKFIHNTNGGSANGVIISDLSGSYSNRYITARRVN